MCQLVHARRLRHPRSIPLTMVILAGLFVSKRLSPRPQRFPDDGTNPVSKHSGGISLNDNFAGGRGGEGPVRKWNGSKCRFIAIMAVALLLPIHSASSGGDDADLGQVKCQTAFRLYNASEVVGLVHVLEMLRAGRTDEAIEELEEKQLGETLAHLFLKDGVVDLRGDSSMIYALEKARRYRTRNPRAHSNPATDRLIKNVLSQVEPKP